MTNIYRMLNDYLIFAEVHMSRGDNKGAKRYLGFYDKHKKNLGETFDIKDLDKRVEILKSVLEKIAA